MSKPKIAVFDFTGCEGCELQILNCEGEIPLLLDKVEIVNFREATSRKDDNYDIALIDGGITTPADVERIKGIREKAKILITIGSCSSTGGINALKNHRPMDEVKKVVYGDKAKHFETIPARPVSAVVKVDLAIPGCPIDKKEFLRCLTELLAGKIPKIPDFSVCMECKLRENECLFEKGVFCLGPLSRAGCEARCPTLRSGCEGCRGLIPDPNKNAHIQILTKYGLSLQEALDQFKLFVGYSEEKVK